MSRKPYIALAGALFLSTAPLYAQSPAPASPTTAPARVLGPAGVRREAGNWLFNDSVFVTEAPNLGAPGSPPFIPSLRRDAKTKLPLFRSVATRGPLNFYTFALPSLREMMVPGYDFVGLQARLTAQLSRDRANGAVYVGWSLPTSLQPSKLGTPSPFTKENATPLLKQLRSVLDAVASDSALILDIDASDAFAISDIDAVAPSCDAVVLRTNFSAAELWPLKVARRVVEEQKGFDLPIFVQLRDAPPERREWDARSLEFYMGGATAIILPNGLTPESWIPAWEASTRRNAGLFVGAVTLEDAAVLPSPNPQTLQIAADLRAAGRIPLAGRLPTDDKTGESLAVVLDDQTSIETLNAIDKAARAGNAIYIEGVPNLKSKVLMVKLGDMTGTNIEILPTAKPESLNLDDPWLFGSARGLELPVMQQVKWTLRTTLAEQTRVKKGEVDQKPYAAAKLASDLNGLLVAPLGKGRLTWLPDTLTAQGSNPARRAFYSAIAGSLQAALVSWKFASVEDETRNGGLVHVALRGSAGNTPLLAVFNDADTDANIALSTRSDATLALDLLTDKALPTTVVGYTSTLNLTVPAHGFRWLAYAKTAKDLDKERLAPRRKASTK